MVKNINKIGHTFLSVLFRSIPFLFAFPSVAAASECDSPIYHRPMWVVGDIQSTTRNDTLFLRYDLRTNDFVADSIFVRLDPACPDSTRRVIYRRTPSIDQIGNLRSAIRQAESTSITGTEAFPTGDGAYASCDFEVYGIDEYGGKRQGCDRAMIRQDGGAFVLQSRYGSGGFRPSGSDKEVNRVLLGFGLGFILDKAKSSVNLEFSGDYGGSHRNYLDRQEFQLGYKYYTGTRINYAPALFGRLEYGTFSAKKDGDWLRKRRQFGIGIGVGFKGRFEELSYSYHTAQNGYHSVELFLATFSRENSRVGSVFAIDVNKETAIFRLIFRAEIANGFCRYNDRPRWHRLPAYSSFIPFFALYGVDYLTEQIFVGIRKGAKAIF